MIYVVKKHLLYWPDVLTLFQFKYWIYNGHLSNKEIRRHLKNGLESHNTIWLVKIKEMIGSLDLEGGQKWRQQCCWKGRVLSACQINIGQGQENIQYWRPCLDLLSQHFLPGTSNKGEEPEKEAMKRFWMAWC